MTRTCSEIFRVANRTRFDAEPKLHGVQIAVGNVLNRASHSWFATAVTVDATLIVTENLRHFPHSACAPHCTVAMSLDDFIGELLDELPTVVGDAIIEVADRRNRPPMTPDDLLKILEQYIPRTIKRLR